MADFMASGKKVIHLSSFKPRGKVENQRISSIKITQIDQHFPKFEFSSTKIGSEDEEAPECLRSLWPFLCLSRFLGICPVWRNGNRLVVKKLNPYFILTGIGFCLQGLMLSHSIKQLLETLKSSGDWVDPVNAVIYYTHTFGNTVFILWNIKEFPNYIQECKKIELICKKYENSKCDDGLVKYCTIVFAFFSFAQLIGNALYYYSTAERYNATSPAEFFQAFNSAFIGEWGSYYTGLFFCLGEFYCDMGWTFGDIFLGLLSIILARYFIRLNREVTIRGNTSLKLLEEIRLDHRSMAMIVKKTNDLFSPLFLLAYVANVGYLLTRLYLGIGGDLQTETISVRIESVYAFIYQVFVKILYPSYLAAQLHEKAHETLEIIHNFPSSATVEPSTSNSRILIIGRFVSQLTTDNIGISGCGYFLITKGFLVTLSSALITYEVIILQFQAASLATTGT